MKTSLYAGLLLTLLNLFHTSVQAVTVRGQMHGLIAEQAETRGEGSSVFGLNGSALPGQAFTVDFEYDTDTAPTTFANYGGTDARANHDSSDPALDWLYMAITVNGRTHQIAGDNRHADILDAFAQEPLNDGVSDFFQLSVEGNSGPAYIDSFRRQFLDIAIFLPNDTLSDITLPTSIYWDRIMRLQNSASFRINEFDIDTASGSLTYERFVHFNLDVQRVEAAVVPLPSSPLLFSSALAGLMLSRKMRPA